MAFAIERDSNIHRSALDCEHHCQHVSKEANMTLPWFRTQLRSWLQKLSPRGVETVEKSDRKASPFETAQKVPRFASRKRRLLRIQTPELSRCSQITEKTSTRSSEFHSPREFSSWTPDTLIYPVGSSSSCTREPSGRLLYRFGSESFNFLPIHSADDHFSQMPCIDEVPEEDSKISLGRPPQLTELGIQGQTGASDHFHVLQEFLNSNSLCKLKLLPEKIREEPRMRYAVDDKGAKVVIVFYDISTFEEHRHVFERLEASKQIPKLLTVIQPRRNYCFLVFPCGVHSLAEHMKKGNLNVFKKKSILLEILEALSGLHEQGIVHGNLNPFNIVYFAEDCSWKLLCHEIGICNTNGEQILCTPVRQLSSYTAPEILQAVARGDSEISLRFSFDMWSYGMIAFKLMTGKRLYRYESPRRVPEIEKLSSGRASRKFKLIHNGQDRELVRSLLSSDPDSRPPAEAVLNYKFFKTLDDSARRETGIKRVLSCLSSFRSEITTLLQKTCTENRMENISADITLEYFRRRSDPSNPFHLREGRKVFIQRDRCLLNDNPAHLLKIGEDYRLRVTLTTSPNLPLRVKQIDSIEVSVSGCGAKSLPVHTERTDSDKHEVCAELKLSELDSEKLDTVSPWCGDRDQQYVSLIVVITLSMEDDEQPQHIAGEIWCRMVSARCPLILPRLLRRFNKQWKRLPQPVRYAMHSGVQIAKFVGCP